MSGVLPERADDTDAPWLNLVHPVTGDPIVELQVTEYGAEEGYAVFLTESGLEAIGNFSDGKWTLHDPEKFLEAHPGFNELDFASMEG